LPALLSLPETETGVRVYNPSGFQPYIVKKDDKLLQERKFYVADSTFFDVFSYRLLKGNAHDVLARPYQVVLTEAMATKYFGNEDPLGKTLFVNGTQDYVVTGVMENVPSNSLLQFDFVASFMSLSAARERPTWWSANYQTFVVVHPNADVKALEQKTNEVVKKALGNELSGPGDYVRYNFTPLTDIYLRSDFNGESEIVSDIKYIYIFAAVAFLILLIACINYINLATARATDRAKEVGIRKVVGAVRKQLFAQFIGESIIVTMFSFALAFLLSQLMLPFFNQLTGKKFAPGILLQPSFLIGSLIALLVIAILSGAYPAFAITNFKPVSVLKGNFKSSGKGIWLRKALVVFQFSISVILIVGTLIIVKQLDFIQGKNLGYDRENTIVLPLDNQTRKVFESLKNELVRNNLATHVPP
jgi:putative ABC transport system permease protein